MLVPVEHKMVSFNGDELMAARANDSNIYVGVRWICGGIGLTDGQADNQQRKINTDAVLSRGTAKMQTPTISGLQEVLFIRIDYLPLWLAKINANIIDDPAVQEKLIAYQLRAKDVLAEAFLPAQKPVNYIDALRGVVEALATQDQRIASLEASRAAIEDEHKLLVHRVNTFDQIDIEGDERQTLNKMVRKLALARGISYQSAYHLLYQAINTALHTNIRSRMTYFSKKRGRDKVVTGPEYLELVGLLPDAIRVADKLLNPGGAMN